MSKVLFSIQYEIEKDKKDEYLTVVKELKNLLTAEGLENYSVYEIKGKPNQFQEIYTFSSNEAYENFDDNQTERISILLNKLNDMVMGSSRYTTLSEIEI